MRAHMRHRISVLGQRQAEINQVVRRCQELLPARLAHLTKEYRRSHRAGKAGRLALRDPRYLAWLDELAEISFEALRVRIEWETSRMIWDAHRSRSSSLRAHS